MITLLFTFLLAFTHTSPRVDAYGDPLPQGAVARLGSVRWRAPAPVESLGFTPDGRYVIGIVPGPEFVVWSYPDGQQVTRFSLPLLEFDYLNESFEPCETDIEQWRFASDSRSALIHYGWDRVYRVQIPDGKYQRIQDGERLEACGISTDGRRRLLMSTPFEIGDGGSSNLFVANSAIDGRRMLLDTLQVSRNVWGGCCSGPASVMAARPVLSANGRYAACGFMFAEPDGTDVRGFSAYDLATGQSWTVRRGPASELRFSPDGRTLLAADWNGISLWRFVTNADGRTQFRPAASLRLADDYPCDPASVRFTPNGRRIVFWTQREQIVVLDSRTLKVERRIPWTAGCRASTVAPDGRTLAVAVDGPPRILFIDLQTGRQLHATPGHSSQIKELRCDSSGQWLLSKSEDGRIGVWDLRTRPFGLAGRRHLGILDPGADASEFQLARGGRDVFFRKGEGDVWRWQIGSPIPTLFIREQQLFGPIWLSDDGLELLVRNGDDRLLRRRIEGPIRELPPYSLSSDVDQAEYEPDGTGVIFRQGNERARFDRATGQRLPVTGTSSSIARRYRVSCNAREKKIEILDVATQKLRFLEEPRLDEHSFASDGCVSPDARLIAYGIGPGPIVRDLDTGEEIVAIGRTDLDLATSVLLPNSEFLIVGYGDGQILMWDLRATLAGDRCPDRLWKDLGADAATSRSAAARLLADPRLAMNVLQDRVRPLELPSEDELCKWVGELDHPRFSVRERAMHRLVVHYEIARPILQLAASEELSLEMRERLEWIEDLAKRPLAEAEVLRLIRAIAILEQLSDRRATELLRSVAAGCGVPAVRAGDALVRRALDR